MSAESWLAFATPLAIIVSVIVQKLDARKVRVKLDKSSKVRDEKLDTIHGLVNGRMGAELRLAMLQARRIASLTHDQRDIQTANEAERAYEEHEAKMTRVDIAASKEIDKPS